MAYSYSYLSGLSYTQTQQENSKNCYFYQKSYKPNNQSKNKPEVFSVFTSAELAVLDNAIANYKIHEECKKAI